MKYFYSAIFLMFFFIGCKEDPKLTGSITGVVTDEFSMATIEGAEITIELLNLSTTSEPDGSFEINGIKAGTYNVVTTMNGYTSAKKVVTVMAEKSISIDLVLSREVPEFSIEAITLTTTRSEESFTITNNGTASMSFTAATSQSWLTVSPSSGSIDPVNSLPVTITADLTLIDYGEYSENIEFNFSGMTYDIPVTIRYVEPADITWVNWYLSVPIDNGSGKATSIFYEDIVNDNLTNEEREYFYFDDLTGSYVFWTKFTGYTTSGYYELNDGHYCRTELREFWQGNQSTSDNWYMNPGESHILESTLNVDYVEGSRERTIVAQIHGKNSTNPAITNGPATVKVIWEKGEVEVEYYVAPANPAGEWTSDTNAKSTKIRVDNEVFTIKLKVDNGVLYWALRCDAKGIDNNYVELYDYTTNGYHYDNYFKTGNYFQWYTDYDKSAQVRLYKVITDHH